MIRRVRRRSTASVDDSKESEVKMYRAILENVRADYPHLPAGALQQIALNQMKSQLAAQPGKRSPTQFGKIQGIISTIFQPSKRQTKDNQNETTNQDEMKIRRSSQTGPHTRSTGMSHIACETSSSSLADHSLADSLADIEEREAAIASAASALGTEERLATGSWVWRRASKRTSIMSNLSDVDEEKELQTHVAPIRRQPSAMEKEVTPETHEEISDAFFTDSLPDEIKIVINNIPISRQRMPSTKRQERCGSGVLRRDSSKNRSVASSATSIDSANFHGDFDAWKSVSSSD